MLSSTFLIGLRFQGYLLHGGSLEITLTVPLLHILFSLNLKSEAGRKGTGVKTQIVKELSALFAEIR